MRKLKWFTLVEILIVIVIIGILIWALVPRMQSAQWRARDVARKNDLSQLQSAIVTSYSDKWEWPAVDASWTKWIPCKDIDSELTAAWLNWVPSDPIKWNKVNLWSSGNEITEWYWYMISKKNWVEKAWFVLMAHTEVEWWSNWVYCTSWTTIVGLIKEWDDLKDIIPCTKLTYTRDAQCSIDTSTHECVYWDPTELRYIMVY